MEESVLDVCMQVCGDTEPSDTHIRAEGHVLHHVHDIQVCLMTLYMTYSSACLPPLH